MKLLIFGDVFGKLGREGVKRMLPLWREEFSPDVVIANAENLAHGKGIGIKQINELRYLPAGGGVDVFTGGNHSVEGKDADKILSDETMNIIRPANLGENLPGRGALIYKLKIKNSKLKIDETISLLVINLIGQVFMKRKYDSPFDAADKILAEHGNKTPYKILDWHADATSEKEIMGWYLDGRVSAVYGTHTHVPTADARILPKGTGYISDVGMTGPHNSIIGAEIEPAFARFKGGKAPVEPVESGPVEVNAVYLNLDQNGTCVEIKHLREILKNDAAK